jgi:hypothetical protein
MTIYVRVCTHTYIFIYTHTHAYMHTCTRIFICRMHKRRDTHMDVYVSIHISISHAHHTGGLVGDGSSHLRLPNISPAVTVVLSLLAMLPGMYICMHMHVCMSYIYYTCNCLKYIWNSRKCQNMKFIYTYIHACASMWFVHVHIPICKLTRPCTARQRS